LTVSSILTWDLLSFICLFSPLCDVEEASVLIGAHTIGLIRNTFGASLAGPVRLYSIFASLCRLDVCVSSLLSLS
jgi:hypothetical protein